jgi:TolB-like protein/Tfp pilus assembly protein PilF
VLPFVNMSNDDDNEYFSDGLTETLLHMLAQIPDLKVAARTSSFAFKEQNKSIQEIAAALGVAHILEGSVQRAGDSVRITAQLIRASDGFHVWSSNYDRTLENIFEIQDEIAQKVGFELSESLLGASNQQLAGVQTTNPDAYDLYLQARREQATGSYGGLKAAEDLLKGALLIDPDFVEAKTELATCYIHQLETGLMDQQDAFPDAMAITEQVLAAQPNNVVAQAIRTYVDAMANETRGEAGALPGAVAMLEQLVATEPGELQVRILLVRAYERLQQQEKSLPVLQEALRADPFNPRIHYELGTLNLELRDFDEARVALETSLEIEPAQPNAYSALAGISRQSGDGVGFVKYFLKALEVDPRDHELPGILADFLYGLELIEEGDDFRERVMAIAPTSEIAYRIDLLRAVWTGDEEDAVANAHRAIEDEVDDRYFAYGGAVEYLVRSAIANGTLEAELEWLEQRAPEIFNISSTAVPPKYRRAQRFAFDAWYVALPRDELLRRLDVVIERERAIGFDPMDEPIVRMNILAMRGEIQEAIQVALTDVFTRSASMTPGWRRAFAQAQLTELVADPRIQAAMQSWEDEEEALRGQVQSYLADLHAAT